MGTSELAYFVAEPPEYEARGDHIIGRRNGVEYVFPIPVAQAIIARLERAVAKWQISKLNDAKVIPIKRKRSP